MPFLCGWISGTPRYLFDLFVASNVTGVYILCMKRGVYLGLIDLLSQFIVVLSNVSFLLNGLYVSTKDNGESRSVSIAFKLFCGLRYRN